MSEEIVILLSCAVFMLYLFNGYVMLILCWCYDYLLIFTYIWIDKSYDSDDLPLTQMVLQRNTGVNIEDEDMEDKEDDENYKETSNEGENESTFLFVIDIKCLR